MQIHSALDDINKAEDLDHLRNCNVFLTAHFILVPENYIAQNSVLI